LEEELYRLMYEVEDRHWWFRGRAAVVEALVDRFKPPVSPRVLDAGCGTGRNLQRYARLGPATGIEPSAGAVEFCRRRGLENVQQASLEQLPFEPESFELLVATDVLEHVDDDALALRELRRVASPEAGLVLTVPAYRWLWSEEDDRLGHCRRYTRRRLRAVVEQNGWRPLFVTYFNLLLLAPIAIARRFRDRTNAGRSDPAQRSELNMTPGWLDAPLSFPMRLEARLIRAGLALPAGVSVGIVCQLAP
jgi:SAM-dependent methyltransferase